MEINRLAPVLFHYTDAETAKTIIRTQEFRLSPKQKLNDDGQITAHLTRVHEIAVKLLGQSKVGDGFLEHMLTWVPQDFYIGCFTESPWNQWMWSNYAQKNGVCLAFYTEGLRPSHRKKALSLHLMHYPEPKIWDAEIERILGSISPLIGDNKKFETFKEKLAEMLIQCLISKHQLYEEEQETRLIYGGTMHEDSEVVEIRDGYAYVKLPKQSLTRVFLDTISSVEAESFIK